MRDQQLVTTPSPKSLGKLSADLIDSYAWLTAPATVHGEIARLERAVQDAADEGTSRLALFVLLADWHAIAAAQRRLLAEEGGQA